MPFEEMKTPELQSVQYQAAPEKTPEAQSFTSMLVPAMQQENDVYNVLSRMTQPAYPVDPNFDFNSAMQGLTVPDEFLPKLASAANLDEFNAIKAKIAEELSNRQAIAAGGWKGMVASMGMGVISPTSLIPLTGAARGAKGIAQTFALAAAAAGGQELVLGMSQETRTGKEMAINIAAGTVLGGLMGTAFKRLTRTEQIALERSFEKQRGQTLITHLDETGAQKTLRIYDGVDESPQARFYEKTLMQPAESYAKLGALVDDHMRVNAEAFVSGAPATPFRADSELGQEITKVYGKEWTDFVAHDPENNLSVMFEAFPTVDEHLMIQSDPNLLQEFLAEIETHPGLQEAVERYKAATGKDPLEFDTYQSPGDRYGSNAGGNNSLSAAQTVTRNTRGLKTPKNIVGAAAFKTLSKLSPLTRQLSNTLSPAARYWSSRLQLPGVRLAEDAAQGPNAVGGSIYARVHGADGATAQIIQKMDDAYYRHLYGDHHPDSEMKRAAIAQIKQLVMSPPPGKMTYKEFNEAVYDAQSTGVVHPDGSVMRGARAIQEFTQFYEKLHDDYMAELSDAAGEEVSPMFVKVDKDNGGPGVENYVHQKYDSDVVIENSKEFISELTAHGEDQLNKSFRKAFEKMDKLRKNLEAQEAYLSMNPAEATKIRNEIENSILDIDSDPAFAVPQKQILEMRKTLSEAGATPKEIAAEIKDFRDTLPPEYNDALAERKRLMATRLLLHKVGGGADDVRVKLEEATNKLFDLQYDEFERVHRKLQKFEKDFARADKKAAGADVDKAFGDLAKSLKTLDTYNKRLYSLRNASDAEVVYGRWERVQAQNKRVEDLIAKVEGKEAAVYDEAAKLIILGEAKDVMMEAAINTNAKRALRKAVLEEKLDAVSPESIETFRKGELERVFTARESLENSFDDMWRKNGATDLNIKTGEVDFGERARENADELFSRIVGNPDRAVGQDIIGGPRSAQLRRTLNLPYDVKKKYLVRDVERMARSYTRTMAPDLELWRATGSVNGAKIFDEIKSDFQLERQRLDSATHVKMGAQTEKSLDGAGDSYVPESFTFQSFANGTEVPKGFKELTPELRGKLSRTLINAEKATTEDFSVMIDRLRHDRGKASDTNKLGFRVGRMAKAANVARLMGSVVPSSFPDIARPVFRYGVMKTMSDGWVPFVGNLTYRRALTRLDHSLGIALDVLFHNRAQAIADMAANHSMGKTKLERGVEFAANKTGLVALFDYWTAGMKHVAASVVHSSMSEYTRIIAKGGTPEELAEARKYLYRLGINDVYARRISDAMDSPGGSTEFSKGVRLPNVEAWLDAEAARAYGAAVLQEVNDLIITPGLELPSVVDKNMAYSVLFQFKSFTFASTSRVAMSGLQGNDAHIVQGISMSLALGALSYYTWAMANGDKAFNKALKLDPEDWIYESIDRSGLLGALSIPQRIGEQIPALNNLALFGGEDRPSRRSSSLMGEIAGPSFNLAERLSSVVMGLDSPTKSTLHDARVAMVPYQNVFYIKRALDAFEEALANTIGLPEKRKSK